MTIQMRFADNVQHHKPHVHVRCGEYKASVSLEGELLAGELPYKKLILLQSWMILREKELYNAWHNAVREIPFDKIDPIK